MNNKNKDKDKNESTKDKWKDIDQLAKLVAGNLMKLPPEKQGELKVK